MTSSTNPRDVPIEAMRELARDHAERTSLRHLAPEIGLGHSTLHNFLNGATPHPRVRRLLGTWYLRMTSGEGGAAESAETYASALRVLLGDLPAPSRERAAGEVLDVVERGYDKAGKTRPGWLDALRESATGRE
ncbi:MAG TPA: hypothetical protein VK358_01260 [Longimicrobium sp.]|nr:hypothetical protein [Longimicrobium sp.]